MSKVTQNCSVYNKLFSCPTYPLWRSLNVSHLRVIFLEIKLTASDSFSSQETTNLIKMMVFIWNCRLCEWTQYIDFFGSNSHNCPRNKCSKWFCRPQHWPPSTPLPDAHVAPVRTISPKNVNCWHRKHSGRNTPAIGSSGSAESVRSHNVPLYYSEKPH